MSFRNAFLIKIAFINNQADVAAFAMTIGGKRFFNMVMEHPDALAKTVQAIIDAAQFQIKTLCGHHAMYIALDIGAWAVIDAVIMGNGRFVSMNMQRK